MRTRLPGTETWTDLLTCVTRKDFRPYLHPVYDAGGQPHTVPLGQVASITRQPSPAQIDHLDRQRVITLEANTHGRALNDVTLDIKAAFEKLNLPPGYTISEGGWMPR